MNRWYLLGYSFYLSYCFFQHHTLFQSGLLNYNKAIQFVPSIDFMVAIFAGKNAAGISQSNWQLELVPLIVITEQLSCYTIDHSIFFF
jgi:hypothetical protein